MLGYISSDRPRLTLRAHRWTSRGAAVVGAASLVLTTATVASAASLKPEAQKAVTLQFVLQGPLTGSTGLMWRTIAADFNKEYAPISVTLVPESQPQIEAEELTVIKGSNPPDMIYWPVGPGYNETEGADEGLLANLLPLYKQEGWLKEMPNITIEYINGGLYNVDGALGAQPYIFYNANLFQKLHLSVPSSFAQLFAVAGKIRAAGYQPLALGSADGWPDVHLMSILTQRALNYSTYNNLLFSWAKTTATPTSWTDPAVVKAFNVLKEMQTSGLLADGSAALTNAEAETVFEDGKAAMVQCPLGCYGPQAIADLIGSRFKVGIFEYPGITPGVPLYQNVATATQEFSVPENAWKLNQPAITDFIKFYNSLQGRTIMLDDGGFLPDNTSGMSASEIAKYAGPFSVQVEKWIAQYGSEQNLDGFLDSALRQQLGIEAADIITGKTTPQAAAQVMQALAVKTHAEPLTESE